MARSGGGDAAAGSSVSVRTNVNDAFSVIGGSGGEAGTTTLFIGDLHWWTTDADLDAELCKYGPVKEAKFFAEKNNGKSKGYAKVEFFYPASVLICKEGMNGHIFNGRPCLVSFSLQDVENMGVAKATGRKRFTNQSPSQSAVVQKVGRGRGGAHVSGNFGREAGEGAQIARNFGRGGGDGDGGGAGDGYGLGSGGMRNREQIGIAGNWIEPPPLRLNPATNLCQAFDPTCSGTSVGRISAGYQGFPAGPAPGAFLGMSHPFPPRFASHISPSLPGRGATTVDVGMWPDPAIDGQGARDHQTIYRDAAALYQVYGEGSHGMEGAGGDWSRSYKRRQAWDMNTGHEQVWYDRKQYDEMSRASDNDRDLERVMEWERERVRAREWEWGSERDRERE